MKTDEEIERERVAMLPIVGPTHADWYAEACRVERDDPTLLWACRVREAVRVHARDLGELATAAEALVRACGRLDEGGGERVRTAVEAVEGALWWREGTFQSEISTP